MKRNHILMLAALGVLVMAGCAGVNPLMDVPDSNGDVAGLFTGLWHGFVIIFSLIDSFFTNSSIYEVHNTGFGYNLGFVIGSLWIPGGLFRIIF